MADPDPIPLLRQLLVSRTPWTFTSSFFPPPLAPLGQSRHEKWMASHTGQHANREILVALRGEGCYGFRNQVFPCPAGSVFLIDAFDLHDSHYPTFAPPAVHMWIRIVLDVFFWVHFCALEDGRERNLLKRQFIMSRPEAGLIFKGLWERAKADRAPAPALYQARLGAALILFLGEVLDRLTHQDRVQVAVPTEDGIMRAIMRHIAEQAGVGLKVGHLARLAGYSEYHFMRVFKRHGGQTVHQYINACRSHRAVELLRSGVSRKETASRLGFAHPSSFSRWWATHRPKRGG